MLIFSFLILVSLVCRATLIRACRVGSKILRSIAGLLYFLGKHPNAAVFRNVSFSGLLKQLYKIALS